MAKMVILHQNGNFTPKCVKSQNQLPFHTIKGDICCLITDKSAKMRLATIWCQKRVKWPFWPLQCFMKMFIQGVFFNWEPLKVLSVRITYRQLKKTPCSWGPSSQVPLLADRWVGESDLASSNKGYAGYREVLGGTGGPNQANLEA